MVAVVETTGTWAQLRPRLGPRTARALRDLRLGGGPHDDNEGDKDNDNKNSFQKNKKLS